MIDFSHICGVILDMDGVIWRGSEILPGVPAFFEFLASHHIPYVFATNNSTRTPEMYTEKISGLGIKVEIHQIVTSSLVTGRYLREHYPNASKAYVVGQDGIYAALRGVGLEIVEDEQADFVVVGLDRTLTYAKLQAACYQIQRGALFIGTNGDVTLPEPDGYIPGAGSILALLETATKQAPLIMGKPEKPMFEYALGVLGTTPETTLMIGDRVETDIWGAKRAGLPSALVLSGVSDEADLQSRHDYQPDGIYQDLADLQQQWPR
ncbi:MAG: HAD family hydrolase [Chloroflexi bacterium]|nr:HAD family hydrolase [Chloroflexota bacterium]